MRFYYNVGTYLGELLALHVHVFHIDVFPGSCLPFVDGGSDQVNVIPQLFQHLDLATALLQQLELGNLNFKQRSRFLEIKF